MRYLLVIFMVLVVLVSLGTAELPKKAEIRRWVMGLHPGIELTSQTTPSTMIQLSLSKNPFDRKGYLVRADIDGCRAQLPYLVKSQGKKDEGLVYGHVFGPHGMVWGHNQEQSSDDSYYGSLQIYARFVTLKNPEGYPYKVSRLTVWDKPIVPDSRPAKEPF